jgi:hypothetical protein
MQHGQKRAYTLPVFMKILNNTGAFLMLGEVFFFRPEVFFAK